MTWPAEEIPGEDTIFRRVHRNHVDADGEIMPSAFMSEHLISGLSTNWIKYCASAAHSRVRAKRPDDYGVVSLVVAGVRDAAIAVQHTPSARDRSHTDIQSCSPSEHRIKLLKLAQWEIRVRR